MLCNANLRKKTKKNKNNEDKKVTKSRVMKHKDHVRKTQLN